MAENLSPPPPPPRLPPPPPPPPASPPPPPPAGSRWSDRGDRFDSRSARTLLFAGGVIVVVSLLTSAGGIFNGIGPMTGSSGSAARRALLGGVVAVVALAAIWLALRSRRHPLIEPGSLRRVLPAAAVIVSLAALIGVATTPLDRERESSTDQNRRPTGRLHPVDRDGDGLADLDDNGWPIYALDGDGDGIPDMYFHACPGRPNLADPDGGEGETADGGNPFPDSGDAIFIDADCDGTIDDVVEFDERMLRVPQARPRSTDDDDQPSNGLRNVGPLLRFIVIAAAVCGLIALFVAIARGFRFGDGQRKRRNAWPSGHTDESGDADESDDELVSAAAVAAALRSSLDPLDHPDPRVAINAAYARLLEGFEGIGLGRFPHEAPLEHLRRCLGRSPFDEPAARQLVELFNLARFSPHPITENHRTLAISALHRLLASIPVGSETAGLAPL